MMVVGLEYKEPDSGEINRATGITNYVGRFTGSVVRPYANNNGRDALAVRGGGSNKLAIGNVRWRMREFRLCKFN